MKKKTSLLKQSLQTIKEAKQEILLATYILIVAILIGYLFPALFAEQVQQIIKELIAFLEGKTTSQLITYIFLNNFKASTIAMLLGIPLAIFPIIITLLNGYIIGYAINITTTQVGITSLWRLIPHGIFELPAVLISIGLGIQLGTQFISEELKIKKPKHQAILIILLLLLLSPLLFITMNNYQTLNNTNPQNLATNPIAITLAGINMLILISIVACIYLFFKNKTLKKQLKESITAFIIIVIPLLIIAAIIEGSLIGLMR